MNAISSHYRELKTLGEITQVAIHSSWNNPEIAKTQAEFINNELTIFDGKNHAAFKTILECLATIDVSGKLLLDVGAGAGVPYGRLFNWAGLNLTYMACDSSEYAASISEMNGYVCDIADARNLPYEDDSFDIVLSSANIMHILEWRRVVSELVRVSRQYVILHRTPIIQEEATRYYEKLAYGKPCLEIHFNLQELFTSDIKELKLLSSWEISKDPNLYYSLNTLLFAKH